MNVESWPELTGGFGMKWEMKLKKVDDLIARSNASLYDRVKLLVEIWEDKDFLAHHDGDIDKAEAMLDTKLGDYGIGFFEAQAILKHFPQRPHWVGNSIRAMLAKALEAEEASRKEAKSPVTRKGPVPRKEHQEIVQQLEQSKKRVDGLQDETGRLRAEIERLREENAMLKGRVAELERILNHQLAGAK
jgi:DNA repair exonuclease SbcCD ATPase subunit